MPKQTEFRLESLDTTNAAVLLDRLAAYGRDGWTLAAVVPTSGGQSLVLQRRVRRDDERFRKSDKKKGKKGKKRDIDDDIPMDDARS